MIKNPDRLHENYSSIKIIAIIEFEGILHIFYSYCQFTLNRSKNIKNTDRYSFIRHGINFWSHLTLISINLASLLFIKIYNN